MKRILLIRFGSIGDVVLTTPAIRAVRKAFPDAHIAMLVGTRSADVVSANPHLDEVIVFRREVKRFSETRRAAAILREQGFDISIDMQRKFRSSLLAYRSGAETRIGYHRPGGFLCTIKMPGVTDRHFVDQHLNLLKPLGIEESDRSPEMFLSDEDRNYADQIFQSQGLNSDSPIIGMFPGAGWPAKCWPAERFAAIGDLAVAECGAQVVIFGGPGEGDIVDDVAQKMKSSAALMKDKMTLRQLGAMIEKCDLFLGNDTGPMHISVAVKTPTIALFGPGNHMGFQPIGKSNIMIRGDVHCSPCKRFTGKCKDNICMKSIAVDEVWTAVKRATKLEGIPLLNTMIVSISALALLIPGVSDSLEMDDEQFLEEIQKRAFNYFWHEANPETGLVKDRASNFGEDKYKVASIAATGFGLAALAVGKEHGWISHDQAYHRAHTTLSFVLDKMENHHGFYYHFVDIDTGERMWKCEVSSIDIALLVAGALFVGEYFKNTEVEALAQELYQHVDFQWLLTDGGGRPNEKLIGHGWKPETGFLKSRWDSYNELMILYLLAMGSSTHPIHESSWEAWKRPEDSYAGYKTFICGPLFVHQFSHIFVDFRSKRDGLGYDYWTSSVNATKANRQFCIDNAGDYKTYSENVWGLTACDGPFGYRAYAAPPTKRKDSHDGTVAPYAPAASIVFTPDLSLSALKHMYKEHSENLWGRYGFSDALNLDQDWFARDVIGIDQGATLLMIENYRSGLIWEHFMRLEPIQKAMSKAEFSSKE